MLIVLVLRRCAERAVACYAIGIRVGIGRRDDPRNHTKVEVRFDHRIGKSAHTEQAAEPACFNANVAPVTGGAALARRSARLAVRGAQRIIWDGSET